MANEPPQDEAGQAIAQAHDVAPGMSQGLPFHPGVSLFSVNGGSRPDGSMSCIEW